LPGAGAFATFTVFVACGALHEAVLLARRGSFHGVVLAGFAGAGILCAISATLAPAKGFEDAGGGGLKKSLSWLATAPVAALLAAFIVPALAE
jgi:hypothetical protein